VSNIEIAEGKVVFQDDIKGKAHRVENLNLGVPFVSTIGQATEIYVMPHFSADINGRPFSLEGRTKPFHETLETGLQVKLTDLHLPYYMEYVPDSPVALESGDLSLDLMVSFLNADGKTGDLKITGQAGLRDLKVTDTGGNPLFNMESLSIEAISADITGREVTLGKISTSGGVLLIDRLEDGTLNLAALGKPAGEAENSPGASEEPEPVAEPAPAWKVALGAFALDNYRVLADNLTAPGSGEAMMSLGSLTLTGLAVDGSPVVIKIGDIQLDGLDAALKLEPVAGSASKPATAQPDGGVADAAGADEAEAPSGGEAAAIIDINRVALTNSRFSFSDQTLVMPFQTELSAINLEITGLSSRPEQTADVDFSALLDKQAPLSLSGRLNPLAENIFVDLGLKFENMELSCLSPYSGHYIGRKIAKGKLFTGFDYTVKEQALAGKNHIFIDQLELGEKVDSPQATSLPVRLAIALLRDREGKIVLDVPVSGDLNDPEFRLGRLILQTFTNLIVKAATSPFSLVSGIMGGADPSHLAFEPGSTVISDNILPALDGLAELLYNRPSLAIELAGFVDSGQDGPALRERLLMDRIKARKQAELPPEEAPSVPLDSITIAPEEYEEYLWQAYKLETFPKQKTALGQDKKLPTEEMASLLRQHIQVDESHFKTLADMRARQVRDYLLASGKVEPERVFVVDSPFLAPEPVETVSGSRVDVHVRQ